MKNTKNEKQIATSLDSQALILDPQTGGILKALSDQLDKTQSEIIREFVNSINRLFLIYKNSENHSSKEDLAFTLDFIISHLHLLPQIADSLGVLSGRDTDIVIGNLQICLEQKTMSFSLGLGFSDPEKIFVTMAGGHVQLFSNRYLSIETSTNEFERLKGRALMMVTDSVPYAEARIELVKCNELNRTPNLVNKGRSHAKARVKEVELTISSHNVKYLPTYHKFNDLMDRVISFLGNV